MRKVEALNVGRVENTDADLRDSNQFFSRLLRSIKQAAFDSGYTATAAAFDDLDDVQIWPGL
ncbi:MAG: hypothetical protein R3E79_31380 [Caldilineaceae bacterium]